VRLPVVVVIVTLSMAAAWRPVLSQQHLPVPLVHFMTPAEIDESGLRTLTPAQQSALSGWFERYREGLDERSGGLDRGDCGAESEVVRTQIEGAFDGWVGDTVFRLKNGQLWQQATPSARYFQAVEPHVTITRSPCVMHVDGMNFTVRVRRLE
jgi:hypothetical protein